jgi:hypothetical protein
MIGSFDSFRRDVESPRQNQSDRESSNQENDHRSQCPLRNFEHRKYLRNDLRDQPGGHRVSDRYAINFSTFELGKKSPHCKSYFTDETCVAICMSSQATTP